MRIGSRTPRVRRGGKRERGTSERCTPSPACGGSVRVWPSTPTWCASDALFGNCGALPSGMLRKECGRVSDLQADHYGSKD